MELKCLKHYGEVIRRSTINPFNPELTSERRNDLLIFYTALGAKAVLEFLGYRLSPASV
jgi:hypothetical protein